MKFEQKAELNELLSEQHRDVSAMVAETELPAIVEEEPDAGPVPAHSSEREKPDETALAAWVDDLREFEVDHAGDSAAIELADKLKSALLDDLAGEERQRMFGDINANDEQLGLVADFHADLALEGAAMEVREPTIEEVRPAPHPSFVDSDFGGGGGGGGGGAGGGAPDDSAPPQDDPPPPADKPEDKRKLFGIGKKDKPPEKPAAPDKKRDGGDR